MIDVNDVEARISILYRLTDPFLKLAPVRPVHVEKKKKADDPTGRTFHITVSGGPTSEIDKLDAQILLNNIIYHLANLKDNLKNKLKKEGIDPSLVEKNINSNLNLQLIADLSNQEKHGYPLKLTRRSELDPLVVNIRHELAVPLTVGWSNASTDSSVVLDADIQDSEGKTISSFRQMVEEAIECWEDFCLTHLPKTSNEIQKRREFELTNIKTAKAINIRLPQVNDILNKQDNWVLCPKEKITPGTMVSVYKLDNDKRIWRGFISRIIEGESTLVRVTDPSMGSDSSYNIDKHLFYQLLPENPEEFYFVSNHYIELRDFRAKQLNRSKNA